MAKLDIKFIDELDDFITSKIEPYKDSIKISITNSEDTEKITSEAIYLDIPTAIKFAKTLRTEINKIKEVSNA